MQCGIPGISGAGGKYGIPNSPSKVPARRPPWSRDPRMGCGMRQLCCRFTNLGQAGRRNTPHHLVFPRRWEDPFSPTTP